MTCLPRVVHVVRAYPSLLEHSACTFDSRTDRMLVVLALLRLGLLKKRVLLFVNGIDAGFRLRLFLESFGVRAAVLNSELPVNSRHHILQACLHISSC